MELDELIKYIKSVAKRENVNIEISKKIIFTLEDSLEGLRRYLKRYELSQFLYYTCHEFNRFSIPTQYYHNKEEFDLFKRYLNLFSIIEGDFLQNILTLKVDLLIWEIFDGLENGTLDKLEDYKVQLEKLNTQSKTLKLDKRKEFIEHYNKCYNLINGIENGILKTNISCLTPVSPFLTETSFETSFEKRKIKISIFPKEYPNPVIQTSEKNVINPSTHSNWQFSYYQIEISITGYIDLLTENNKLYGESAASYDIINLKIYNYIYKFLSEVFWRAKLSTKSTSTKWQIQPTDIEKVTYSIEANGIEIVWVHYPFNTSFSISSKKGVNQLDLPANKIVTWYERCLVTAKDYFFMGNSHMSLFWLNVGIEAFLRERFVEICQENGIEYKSLFSVNYFDRTKRELEKINSKKVFNQIKWPKPQKIHLSMYKKIKILSQKNLLTVTEGEIKSKYNEISKYRNSVFHGELSKPIDIKDIRKALTSYEWLLENL